MQVFGTCGPSGIRAFAILNASNLAFMAQAPVSTDYAAFPVLPTSATPGPHRRTGKCAPDSASLSGPSLNSSTDGFAPHFERQQAAMCGLHALNHAVGCSMFTPSDLDAAVRRIVDEAQRVRCKWAQRAKRRLPTTVGLAAGIQSKCWLMLFVAGGDMSWTKSPWEHKQAASGPFGRTT